jgi:F0F1-type ATP synthase delta subunit
MSRQSILTGFDEKNLPVLRNELQRLWDTLDAQSKALDTKVSTKTDEVIIGGWKVTVASDGTIKTEKSE